MEPFKDPDLTNRPAHAGAQHNYNQAFDTSLKRLVMEARGELNIPYAGISFFPKTKNFLDGENIDNIVFIPSESAACISAIVEGGLFSVTEMHFHNKFSSNQFVKSAPFIRSYIGCAVLDKSGAPIGTVCAFDTVSRHFTEQDGKIVQAWAMRAAAYVERLALTKSLAQLPPNAKFMLAIDIATELGYAEIAKHMITVLYASHDEVERKAG